MQGAHIQTCISMISCHSGPIFLGKCHPGRNMVVLIALAGYSQIKLGLVLVEIVPCNASG